MQLSWESSSELRGRPFFTEAQPLTNSVGPVWRRGASSRAGCVGSCFLVDMFEESCNEPSWLRGSAGTMACDFGLRRGTKPPCARAVPRSAMAWGAGRCATGGIGGVARRPACGVFVPCRLARRAQCRVGSRVCLGSPPFARCGPVLLDFSRSIIQQRHKNGVVNLDHRFTPYSQFFDAALPALFRTSKHQVRAIISGAQQGEGVQQ